MRIINNLHVWYASFPKLYGWAWGDRCQNVIKYDDFHIVFLFLLRNGSNGCHKVQVLYPDEIM